MTDTPYLVKTDEAQDVASSIRHALQCWALTIDDPHAWKFVILALHGALQGACVCHLVTTASPVGAVTKRNTCEWLNYFENSHIDESLAPPKTQLMALPELLKAVRKADSAGQNLGVNRQVTISDSELNSLIRIHNQFRNQFVHFSPTGWRFDVSGMQKLAQLIARIIQDILVCGWAFRHLGEEQREMLKEDLRVLTVVEMPLATQK